LKEELAEASPDLLRELLTTFVNALLSAQADSVCGAGHRCGRCVHTLKRASQDSNRKLRDISEDVMSSGRLPLTPALRRRARAPASSDAQATDEVHRNASAEDINGGTRSRDVPEHVVAPATG
jgi:bacterioferritin-associated ferredoxin